MTTIATGLGHHTDETAHESSDLRPDHHPTGSEQERRIEKRIVLYLVGGLLVFVTTLAGWLGIGEETVTSIPAAIGSILLFFGLARLAWPEVASGKPMAASVAALAVLAAIASQEYETAGYVAFILLVFDMALTRTAWGARRAIEQLVSLTPDDARLVAESGEETTVPVARVKVGDLVRVRPGENLPVDGEVVKGATSINQASLTGEALPVEVEPGASVYAGTTNLTGVIELRATSVGEDTTIGKVATLIHEAENARTPRQLIIEMVARYFVPVALVVAALVWYFTQDVETAITVLIVCAPVALLIASPTAMMAAFAAAARLGIMIKQTNYLEAAGDIDTVVFDKTGTLTTGRFAVSRLAPAEGVEGADLLTAAAVAEQHSNHPLARSIMDTARQARIEVADEGGYEEVHGKGVRAPSAAGDVLAGRSSWILELHPHLEEQVRAVEKKIEGMTGVHVMRGDSYLGAVGLEDKLRHNAKAVVSKVRELGPRSIVLLTGDRFAVAKRVGIAIDVDRIEAERLPEEKHALIGEMTRAGERVLMVGDGINDGPSLAAADVGVAMGLSGSDIATNSAGVALMTDDVGRVPFLIMLARRTRVVITQNIIAAILITLVGLVLAASGNMSPLAATIYYIGGAVFVAFNSFRLFRFAEDYTAAEQPPATAPAPSAASPTAR